MLPTGRVLLLLPQKHEPIRPRVAVCNLYVSGCLMDTLLIFNKTIEKYRNRSIIENVPHFCYTYLSQ